MERRVADEVDHARLANGLGVRRIVGVGPAQNHPAVDRDTQPPAPLSRRVDRPARMFERICGREDHDLGRLGDADQAAVEFIVGDEGAAAEEGDHSGHGSDCMRPGPTSLVRCDEAITKGCDRRVGNADTANEIDHRPVFLAQFGEQRVDHARRRRVVVLRRICHPCGRLG